MARICLVCGMVHYDGPDDLEAESGDFIEVNGCESCIYADDEPAD